jgi:16S rRNA (cytosine1402-N4)-methyltransferase
MGAPGTDPDRMEHVPVLYQSVLDWLQPQNGKRYLDGTVGGGGHAQGILQRGAWLLGLDRDADALRIAEARLAPFGERAILRQSSYARAKEILEEIGWGRVTGILLDLGISSYQLADPVRGFAFRRDGPLDMRFDRSGGETAADMVNTLPEEEITRMLFVYGEERNARRIAHEIVRRRPVTSTGQLADVVAGAGGYRNRVTSGLHPATRTFQALRIAVNHELQELEAALPDLMESLEAGGRMAVITFHSLEDRLVKRAFRKAAGKPGKDEPAHPLLPETQAAFRDVTPKPVRPGPEEITENPRARSAKLRVLERA